MRPLHFHHMKSNHQNKDNTKQTIHQTSIAHTRPMKVQTMNPNTKPNSTNFLPVSHPP